MTPIFILLYLLLSQSNAFALTIIPSTNKKLNSFIGLKIKQETPETLSGCLLTRSYNNKSLPHHIGQSLKIMDHHKLSETKEYKIQPYFSGLRGPVISILNSDVERVHNNQASVNETYHNTRFDNKASLPCKDYFTLNEDTEIINKVDLFESHQSPLYITKIRTNNQLHLGGYFLGTASASQTLLDNLEKDSSLQTINRNDPIRQDELGYAWQGLSVDRLMLSSFFTPKPNLYTAFHGGYLEEMFFGFGGELLYRPFDKNFALGGEVWQTTKRVPYQGGFTLVDKDNTQTSALLNLWYDLPSRPHTLGLSLGRFLDGDIGFQIKNSYNPAQGWTVENSLTLSNENEKTLGNDSTNMIIGTRLTIPLGEIPYVTQSLRQTTILEPFARDKSQRIDNPYPLYDLTDSWSAKNIHRYWGDIKLDK